MISTKFLNKKGRYVIVINEYTIAGFTIGLCLFGMFLCIIALFFVSLSEFEKGSSALGKFFMVASITGTIILMYMCFKVYHLIFYDEKKLKGKTKRKKK